MLTMFKIFYQKTGTSFMSTQPKSLTVKLYEISGSQSGRIYIENSIMSHVEEMEKV